MVCQKCGEEIKEIENFIGKCGKKQQKRTVTENKKVKILSLNSYKHFMREEKADHFKPSKSSTSASSIIKKGKSVIHNVKSKCRNH